MAGNLHYGYMGVAVEEETNKVVIPKWIIAMWSGIKGDIPPLWAPCDGTNGTPRMTSGQELVFIMYMG